jgi:hypothetical protein
MFRDMALHLSGQVEGVVGWQEVETNRRQNGVEAWH